MNEKTKELIEFIVEYGQDVLGDGTKSVVVESLKNGNDELALEILKSIDKQWIARAKEIHKFYFFTDYLKRDFDGNPIVRPIYSSCYIDSQRLQTQRVPTLKRIRSKDFCFYDPDINILNNSKNVDSRTDEGWEI